MATTQQLDTTINAEIDKFVFHSTQNDYAILRMKGSSNKGIFTAVGTIPDIPSGTSIQLTGAWIVDKKYGEQFSFQSYQIIVPDTIGGVVKYLGSGLIKGIGPATAARIVEKFGLETISIIDTDPARLAEIPRLGVKKIMAIRDSWQAQKDIQEVMIFLQGAGISSSYAAKIYKVYGKDTIAKVKYNPYGLADDVWGIGFKKADSIAKGVGIPADSIIRVKAGVLYALTNAADCGHCYLPKDQLITESAKILAVSPTLSESVLQELVNDEKIFLEDNERVYLPYLRTAEIEIAERIQEMVATDPLLPNIDIAKAISWAERRLNITFAAEQREAIKKVFDAKITVITGGPGTGKSTLLRGLLLILKSKNVKVKLAAPTGKAAKRMEELTGEPAQTIHRLLEFDPASNGFQKDCGHYLKDVDVLVLDEVSMLDVRLCNSLLKAVPQTSSIVFIGDIDQLPSVGSGDLLKDLIASRQMPVTTLTQIFRQGEGSLISVNAQRINQGAKLDLRPDLKVKDFYYIEKNTPEEIVDEIVSLVKLRLPKAFGFNHFLDIQVLSPMHRGAIGNAALNTVLQQHLNPAGISLSKGFRTYRVGDKVLQLKNCYDKQVYNGDSGIIENIDLEEKMVYVNFDGRQVEYDHDLDLDELTLAYSSTVHKSQGCEFPCVIIPIHTTHFVMLARNLLYTAVTRGKKCVIIVGSRQAVAMCIKNNNAALRHTTLARRITEACSQARANHTINLGQNYYLGLGQ